MKDYGFLRVAAAVPEVRVASVSLSPRGDWHMASDAWSDDFLEGLK
jgi:hypothetical protein